jgi:hypothetical protein
MKKLTTLIVIGFALTINKGNAQDADFQPAWYIVEKGCQFSDGTIVGAEGQEARETLSVGEVVFVYMESGGVYYCISPTKEELFIKGTLTKVSVSGKVGILTEAVSLMDTDLSTDEAFWVTNIDAGTGQATILLAGGQKQNIPSKSVVIISKYLNKVVEILTFNPAAL